MTSAGELLSQEFMSPARDYPALKTYLVYITRARCGHRVHLLQLARFEWICPASRRLHLSRLPPRRNWRPSFETTLRAADISEEVIKGFRVHKIKSAAIFAAMDTTAEELKDTVREAFWR